ncbi:DNA-3-methyladenine glycosylase 2 family protein [bacterium]|nr:MAG: DNA-3-methyladenine glycosylase 2 family protein [bacterium]
MNIQTALDHLSDNDPIMAALIDEYPAPSFIAHTNYYQALVESIIGQQLSVKAAAAIRDRLVGLFHDTFPTPEHIIAVDVETYRSIGLSRPKARYIIDLAEHVLNGRVRFDRLDTMSNQDIIDELTTVKGIGAWTVHMFLMFCMGRLDILPVGDLGIRNAIEKNYELEFIGASSAVENVAKHYNWHPYESIASYYLWQSLENKPAIS